jgi:transcriptional regulator with XRE-family HTH domain
VKKVSPTKGFQGRMADRIRTARQGATLSQAELAIQLGVTPGAVAQWESLHGTKPKTERLIAIAAATGTEFNWLATGQGDLRRRKKSAEQIPALALDAFAQDLTEELLLDRFRRLSPRAKALLSDFLDAITARRRQKLT